MAEDIVVKEVLSPEMIDAGQRIVSDLDAKAPFSPAVAMWVFLAERGRWALVLVPQDTKTGTKAMYTKLLDVLQRLAIDESVVAFNDISILDANHPLIRGIRAAIHAPHLSRIRFSRNVINGMYIDDALLYRVTPVTSEG